MNTGKSIAFGACLTLVSFAASAHITEEDHGHIENDGSGSYVTSDGAVLKTGLGDCMHTGTFSDDAIINVCEGIEEEVAEVEPEPVAEVEETVVAEAPAPNPGKIDTQQFSEEALFDTDSAQLTSAGEAAMNGLFGALAEYKGITDVSVTGHTDSRGAEEYNQALSERRAQTVAGVIAAQYPDVRIDVQGMGETSPVASNDTAEGRQLNRRVEVEVTATRMVFN